MSTSAFSFTLHPAFAGKEVPGSGGRRRCREREVTARVAFHVDFQGMPAKSKKQQMAAGAALAAKRGELKKTRLKGASRSMEKSMSKKELEELASTKRKSLPEKKE